jgi:hypothetical protein
MCQERRRLSASTQLMAEEEDKFQEEHEELTKKKPSLAKAEG